jgi:hypothetical protein
LGLEPDSPGALSIIAYLPSRLLRHLQYILGPTRAPVVARSWDELLEQISSEPISVAIIDPSSDGPGKALEMQQLMLAYPSLPIIAYVPLSNQAFTMIAQLSQSGLKHSVLYAHDDAAARFLPLIDQVRASPLTAKVIDHLRPRLVMLPLKLSKAVEEMFAEPHRYSNAQYLGSLSTISLVKVYRACRESRLPSPKKMFVAAKLLKGYAYLGDPAHSVGTVAKKLGYRYTRIFVDHSSEVFGMNPSRLHDYMSEEQIVERILAWLEMKDAAELPERVETGERKVRRRA